MSMDLTGITNQNEYYTNHYFSSIFEENASDTISQWRAEAKESESVRTPWALLRDAARQYYPVHDRFLRSKFDTQTLGNIRMLADVYLSALGYPEASPEWIDIDDTTRVPVYLELNRPNGAPALWIMLATSEDKEAAILEKYSFSANDIGEEGLSLVQKGTLTDISNEDLVTKIFFGQAEPPRFILLIGMNQIALIDRNKWNEKRYLQFELEEIFSRHEDSTLQAMAVLLHHDSLCPKEGTALLDELDANSQKHAAGVSQDLKYALRESIELLGNEVLYDMAHRQGRDFESNPVDAGELTIECLRYMYRMLFVLFIEARPELGYAPIKAQSYLTGYSFESLRDIADDVRDAVSEVGDGYYLYETLSKLYDLIYNGYPSSEEENLKYTNEESVHDMFVMPPLKAHIFDPQYTKMIGKAKIRNRVMLRIIDLMSLTRETGRRNDRRGRISYANLGINQMGSVYEALLSYRGFIAEDTLFEVKRAGDKFNELDVGYFIREEELDQYTEDERVRYEKDDPDGRYKKGQLRKYEKGSFIYRLAGREREKSASYYTPEVLTKCLVKYALKELLEGKTADEILQLTVCEPAMGSAAFLNEAINQLAEAYLDRRQKERGEMIPAEKRLQELQKVKMYIADRNVYGIDLNSIAVELAEVSLWLNTIYEGGYVPWFGTQLVNGNSLIGARRQVYPESALKATSKGMRWYEREPDRVPLGEDRKTRRGSSQIYHFLLGDPGMCSYNDKVIKSLEPDNIKRMKNWNKEFTKPYSDEDILTLQRLSSVIDRLWNAQVTLRHDVEAKTQDKLSVYGWEDAAEDSHTTIRQKDKILSELYKSEHMQNAGPYARLKFAMDYWCSLWFWPIDKADLLPTRSEFFFDMSLILEGTMSLVSGLNYKGQIPGQVGLFQTEIQEMASDIAKQYEGLGEVDIPALITQNPRLKQASIISDQNHFMHWELEFADLFAEKGGFDLVIGNPPWVLLGWNEQGVLADQYPVFAVKKMNAVQTANHRQEALKNPVTYKLYMNEFEETYGQQSFLNAFQNYAVLSGMKANLYKCFLPQAWYIGSNIGISAFVHPDSVYDDPKGGLLREELYPRLRMHFQFTNELKLFAEVDHHMGFGLNVYSNKMSSQFISISNLFVASTIDECFDLTTTKNGKIPGIKDENGNWNTNGHKGRIVHIGKAELSLFSKLFDGNDNYKQARLPAMHAQALLDVLERFAESENTLGNISQNEISYSVMFDEAADANAGVLKHEEHFPEDGNDYILSGPNIGVANPFFKAVRAVARLNSDYDPIDLSFIDENYRSRCLYRRKCSPSEFINNLSDLPWGGKYNSVYRIAMRRMLNISGERTLMPCIIAPGICHINGVYSIALVQKKSVLAGAMASIPYDFYVKITGKTNGGYNIYSAFPMLDKTAFADAIAIRALLLNCLSDAYKELWNEEYEDAFCNETWSKADGRLKEGTYERLTHDWDYSYPLRTDYERRQALIEIDVLTAMALGMTLEQLKAIYQIQFPVLQSYEADTWFDVNGRIVFTNNRSLTGVGFDRNEWENGIKGASDGKRFYRTIKDDTMPGGLIERTIEYVAPFDRCDREQDYETAWKFFEEKYKDAR